MQRTVAHSISETLPLRRAGRPFVIPVLVFIAALAPHPAAAVTCAVDPVPAATLLLPYFELDLDHPNGLTTLFAINNATANAVLTQVTFWSDLSVPILTFNVYLTGYDVQTINVRDVLVYGNLPQTASAAQDENDTISPRGPLSQDIGFASCNGILPPPPLPAAFVQHVQLALSGRPSPMLNSQCAGQNLGDHLARGYVTVDTVSACGPDAPGSASYFGPSGTAKATDQNFLWGNWYIVNVPDSYVLGSTLVGIEADPASAATTTAGNYTFYGRYDGWSAADHREPLATSFAAQYFNSSGPSLFQGGSDLIVWRDPKGAQQPFACPATAGQRPQWYPLGQEGLVLFDESEHAVVVFTLPFGPPPGESNNEIPFPAATQKVRINGAALPVPFQFGWMYLDLNVITVGNPVPPADPKAAQAYVIAAHVAAGHAVATDAFRLDSACNPSHSAPH